tara:strand:+ start:227 stop:655 length:429 start_codon:yes stop_codon:yes gene_type:complete
MSDDLNPIEVKYMGLTQDGQSIALEIEGEEYYWPRKYAKHFYQPGSIYEIQGLKTEEGTWSMAVGTATYLRSEDVDADVVARNGAGEKFNSAQLQGKKAIKRFNEEDFGNLTLNQLRNYIQHKGKDAKAGLIAKMISHLEMW